MADTQSIIRPKGNNPPSRSQGNYPGNDPNLNMGNDYDNNPNSYGNAPQAPPPPPPPPMPPSRPPNNYNTYDNNANSYSNNHNTGGSLKRKYNKINRSSKSLSINFQDPSPCHLQSRCVECHLKLEKRIFMM